MAPPRRTRPRSTDGIDYGALAELRYRIRRFLRVREIAARAIGVEPQQYLLLLHVRARRGATIGALAEQLQIAHHSAVELVDRLMARGLIVRRRTRADRREVAVALTRAGRQVVRTLARQSVWELRAEGPALVSILRRLIGSRAGKSSGRPRAT